MAMRRRAAVLVLGVALLVSHVKAHREAVTGTGTVGTTRFAEVSSVAAVRVLGNSGWIEFCDRNQEFGGEVERDATALSADCVSLKVVSVAELSSTNRIVSESVIDYSASSASSTAAVTIGEPVALSLPRCGGPANDGGHVHSCGAAAHHADGDLLEYFRIPITIPLSPTGTLRLDAIIFTHGGYFVFDDASTTVGYGTLKLDWAISSYTFSESARHLAFELLVKDHDRRLGDIFVTRNSSQYVNVNAGALVGFPRYAMRSSVSASAWQWRAPNVVSRYTTRNQTVMRISFEGPFTDLEYDSLIAGDAAPPPPADNSRAVNIGCAVAGALAAGIALLALV